MAVDDGLPAPRLSDPSAHSVGPHLTAGYGDEQRRPSLVGELQATWTETEAAGRLWCWRKPTAAFTELRASEGA